MVTEYFKRSLNENCLTPDKNVGFIISGKVGFSTKFNENIKKSSRHNKGLILQLLMDTGSVQIPLSIPSM